MNVLSFLAQAHGASDLMTHFAWADVASHTELMSAVLIVGLPLLGALVTFLAGKGMWRGGAAIPVAAMVGSLLASLYLFWNHIVDGAEVADYTTEWFHVGGLTFTVGFLLDNLAVWMATLVSLLSLLITIFATSYLSDESDAKLRRYFAVKSLFVAGMLGTVLLDNYLLMFVFWEVMGLCSYLLIGYWYERESAAVAAKKAFLTTRLGDILLLIGLFLILFEFHTLSYRSVFAALQAGEGDP